MWLKHTQSRLERVLLGCKEREIAWLLGEWLLEICVHIVLVRIGSIWCRCESPCQHWRANWDVCTVLEGCELVLLKLPRFVALIDFWDWNWSLNLAHWRVIELIMARAHFLTATLTIPTSDWDTFHAVGQTSHLVWTRISMEWRCTRSDTLQILRKPTCLVEREAHRISLICSRLRVAELWALKLLLLLSAILRVTRNLRLGTVLDSLLRL